MVSYQCDATKFYVVMLLAWANSVRPFALHMILFHTKENEKMTVRFACEKDIPQMNSLLYQVERVHQQGRPDLFKEGAKKYTDNELKDMLKDKTKPIFAAVDENDVMKGYAFCVFQEHKGDNVLTDIKTLYIDDLCVDENCRGQHIGSVLYEAVKKFAKEQGCYNVTLNVWECNPSARKFYGKAGLKPYKTGMEVIL